MKHIKLFENYFTYDKAEMIEKIKTDVERNYGFQFDYRTDEFEDYIRHEFDVNGSTSGLKDLKNKLNSEYGLDLSKFDIQENGSDSLLYIEIDIEK